MSNLILNTNHDFCNNMDQKMITAMVEALPNNDSINNKLFEDESLTINKLSNTARRFICLLLKNHPNLKAKSGTHFDEAKNKIASDIANKVPEIIKIIEKC